MAEVGKVTYTIAGDNTQFEQDVNKSESIASKAGAAIKTTFAAVGAALVAVGAGVVSLGKKALDAYGEYEQLAGGAELMFGEAYGYIAEKAKNAWKSVQMSTNDYLTTANGYAVALREALGGDSQAAAELADNIITAQADIVAATGKSAESVKNAFDGVLRGEYSMLDNLGLGVKATKEGLQEVIDKVNEHNKEMGNATQYSIDNVADIEQALVEYVDMVGMAGYASEEGATTIQGSIATVKSTWDNLMAGLMDPDADIGELVDNFSTSVLNLAENIVPLIKQFLPKLVEGTSQLISDLAPELPGILNDLLPSLVSGTVLMLTSLSKQLPTLISVITSVLPSLIRSICGDLIPAVLESIPDVIDALVEGITEDGVIDSLVQGLISVVNALVENLPDIIQSIIDAIPVITEAVNQAILDNFPALLSGIIQLILMLIENLPPLIQTLVDQIPSIVSTIVQVLLENLPTIIMGIVQIVLAIVAALPEILSSIWDSLVGFIEGMVDGIGEYADDFGDKGEELLSEFWDGICEIAKNFWNDITTLVQTNILDPIGDFWEDFKAMGGNLISGLWQGISDKAQWLWEKVSGFFSSLTTRIKNFFGIKSPSKLFASYGRYMDEGLVEGIEDGEKEVTDTTDSLSRKIVNSFDVGGDFSVAHTFGLAAAQPVYATIQLNGSVDVDGFTLGKIMLENLDDAAAFTLRG